MEEWKWKQLSNPIVLLDWYKEASQTLEEYHKASVQHEQEQEATENAETLKELEPVLKKLNREFDKNDDVKFLAFLYKEHEPVNKNHKLKENYHDQLKQAFRIAVTHYHPDKIDVKKHDRKLKVLYQEITKLLTKRYEYFKGCD